MQKKTKNYDKGQRIFMILRTARLREIRGSNFGVAIYRFGVLRKVVGITILSNFD